MAYTPNLNKLRGQWLVWQVLLSQWLPGDFRRIIAAGQRARRLY